jgi:hypothetical protein
MSTTLTLHLTSAFLQEITGSSTGTRRDRHPERNLGLPVGQPAASRCDRIAPLAGRNDQLHAAHHARPRFGLHEQDNCGRRGGGRLRQYGDGPTPRHGVARHGGPRWPMADDDNRAAWQRQLYRDDDRAAIRRRHAVRAGQRSADHQREHSNAVIEADRRRKRPGVRTPRSARKRGRQLAPFRSLAGGFAPAGWRRSPAVRHDAGRHPRRPAMVIPAPM